MDNQETNSDKISKKEFLLMFTLMITSGNPLISQFKWLNIILAILCLIYWTRSDANRLKASILYHYIGGVFIIFILQTLTFGWNTIPGIINFGGKLFWGASIYLYLENRFKHVYLRVLTILAGISIVCWLLSQLNIVLPGIGCRRGSTILLYTYVREYGSGAISLRNSGFAWEAGAFGCYLVFTFILFIKDLGGLWRSERKSIIIIVFAMSTTAYIAFVAIVCSYILLKSKSRFKYIWIAILLFASFFVGQKFEFLTEKVDSQLQSGISANGKFNSTRFGSFLFDWYYIEKHPLVGNGLHSQTRYSEHKNLVELWDKGKEAYSGNGFSGIIASMGSLFILLYFVTLFRNNKLVLQINDKIIIVTGVILLLFGEPLLDYPLFLGYPMDKYCSSDLAD